MIQWKQCSDSSDSAYDSVVYHRVKTGSLEAQAEVEEPKIITKHVNMHCDWFILWLLLPTLTIWFSLDHKQNVSDWGCKLSQKKMEMFWFFWLQFRRAYDSAYNSDSIASENLP